MFNRGVFTLLKDKQANGLKNRIPTFHVWGHWSAELLHAQKSERSKSMIDYCIWRGPSSITGYLTNVRQAFYRIRPLSDVTIEKWYPIEKTIQFALRGFACIWKVSVIFFCFCFTFISWSCLLEASDKQSNKRRNVNLVWGSTTSTPKTVDLEIFFLL